MGVIAAHPGLRQQQGPRADMESAPTVRGTMLVIDPEMPDAARLLRASNQARKASLCFTERRQLLYLLVGEKIQAEGLRHLLEYRAPRALPGGRCGARLRVQPKVGQQENPKNFLLMHAMGPNVAGVIGSAVAAGILLSFLG